jgi:transcriptional regulator of aroF, aroG, tyrA and aromatic amino acid transport
MKLKMVFKDRIGIVSDVSRLVANFGMNISSMEVERKEDKAAVYLEADGGKNTPTNKDIFHMLGAIPDLFEIRFVDTMPHEDRENQIRVVLDNISDGVISIDTAARITTINRVARKVFDCEHREMIGKGIKELDLPDDIILDCLEGKKFNNVKKDLITEKGRLQYFATGRPIKDWAGRIIGAVEIGRDVHEIKMLAQSISMPARITFNDFIGESRAIKDALAFAQKIACTDSIISIRGESGTGKELLAHAIHTASGREGSFVPINCAALPESLLESELFGYVGGAFTGAHKGGKPGLFEIAENGTLFLDEIAELPLGQQARILRTIQESRVRRIGGTGEIPINARIITATNQNLEQMVEQKLFRQDLFYRINVLPIHLPPLRVRMEDIPQLTTHFLFQLASKLNQKEKNASKESLYKLSRHGWPGNVRELKNVVERAAILSDYETIDVDCILFSYEIGKSRKEPKNEYRHDIKDAGSLKNLVARYEKEIIVDNLKKSNSIRKAAKELKVSHTALLIKMKKYKIDLAR